MLNHRVVEVLPFRSPRITRLRDTLSAAFSVSLRPLLPDPFWCSSQLLSSGVTLLFVLYTKVKPRVAGGKEALEVQDHNLEEGGGVPEVFDG